MSRHPPTRRFAQVKTVECRTCTEFPGHAARGTTVCVVRYLDEGGTAQQTEPIPLAGINPEGEAKTVDLVHFQSPSSMNGREPDIVTVLFRRDPRTHNLPTCRLDGDVLTCTSR